MNQNEKTWQDRHIKRYIAIALGLSMLVFSLFVGFKRLLNPKLSWDYVGIVLILGFSGLLLINVLRIKLSEVYSDGIRIGNAPDNSYEKFRLKHKPILINWDDIKNIKIYGKDVSTALAPGAIDILLIKTKDNIKFESFIAQPKGFVKALKSLNKHHLLSKDSKYRDTTKK